MQSENGLTRKIIQNAEKINGEKLDIYQILHLSSKLKVDNSIKED